MPIDAAIQPWLGHTKLVGTGVLLHFKVTFLLSNLSKQRQTDLKSGRSYTSKGKGLQRCQRDIDTANVQGVYLRIKFIQKEKKLRERSGVKLKCQFLTGTSES